MQLYSWGTITVRGCRLDMTEPGWQTDALCVGNGRSFVAAQGASRSPFAFLTNPLYCNVVKIRKEEENTQQRDSDSQNLLGRCKSCHHVCEDFHHGVDNREVSCHQKKGKEKKKKHSQCHILRNLQIQRVRLFGSRTLKLIKSMSQFTALSIC